MILDVELIGIIFKGKFFCINLLILDDLIWCKIWYIFFLIIVGEFNFFFCKNFMRIFIFLFFIFVKLGIICNCFFLELDFSWYFSLDILNEGYFVKLVCDFVILFISY